MTKIALAFLNTLSACSFVTVMVALTIRGAIAEAKDRVVFKRMFHRAIREFEKEKATDKKILEEVGILHPDDVIWNGPCGDEKNL